MENINEQIPCVKIRIGNQHYQIPLDSLEKVVTWPNIQPVPEAPPGIKGIAFENGEVVTYLYLDAGEDPKSASETCCGILIRTKESGLVGIAADELCEEMSAAREEMEAEKEEITLQWRQLFGGIEM